MHDGSIVKANGSVPGTVKLDVDIQYLRERFKDPGGMIHLTLVGCTRFAYRDYEDKELNKDFITDLSAIAAIELQILSAEMLGGLANITCHRAHGQGGELEVEAADVTLALDGGRIITLEELIQVANGYWEDFRARCKVAYPR